MNLEIFENNGSEIRGFMVEDEPYFVAKDIAIALGYDFERSEKKSYNPTNAMTKIIEEEDIFSQKMLCSSKSQIRDLGLYPTEKLVNESGMYQAIFGSQLKSAKDFKRWVAKEVLPSLRKTGSYVSKELSEKMDRFLPKDETYGELVESTGLAKTKAVRGYYRTDKHDELSRLIGVRKRLENRLKGLFDEEHLEDIDKVNIEISNVKKEIKIEAIELKKSKEKKDVKSISS